MSEAVAAALQVCKQCQAQIPAALLACPACAALVHADELKRLAGEAEAAETSGDLTRALTLWREAVVLLPSSSRQYAAIAQRIQTVSQRLDDGGQKAAPASSKIPKPLAALGAVGVLLWKFKLVLFFVLSKAKLLFLGLTKASTFFSMFATFGIYWAMFGWQWALGFVLCIYVHEMGHVFALRRYGIPATSPMFVPGLGAFVRLKQYPADVREDARIGLAGPVWGMLAALVCGGLYLTTGRPIMGAIAYTAAALNLFNLIPIWQLDGGRGFRALSMVGRWVVVAAIAIICLVTGQGFLWILAALAAFRAFTRDGPEKSDQQALATYVLLVLILSGLMAKTVTVAHGSRDPGGNAAQYQVE